MDQQRFRAPRGLAAYLCIHCGASSIVAPLHNCAGMSQRSADCCLGRFWWTREQRTWLARIHGSAASVSNNQITGSATGWRQGEHGLGVAYPIIHTKNAERALSIAVVRPTVPVNSHSWYNDLY